jgi:hypothetical protein
MRKPLPKSRKHLHNLVRIQRVNRSLLATGMSYKAIGRFWSDCSDEARLLPTTHPCARKYGERQWLKTTRQTLAEAGISSGLLSCRNVD